MNLLIFRHAQAGDREEFAEKYGLPDELRPLTPEGRKKMRKVVRELQSQDDQMDVLWSSDLERAKETAEIIGKTYRVPKIEIKKELHPSEGPDTLLSALQELSAELTVAVVGHEPYLSRFISWITIGQTQDFIRLKKGGVALVRFNGLPEKGQGQLRWLMGPRQIIK